MEVKQITYSHDKKTEHLKSVTGEIELGKVTTIIGPNGCGKSTLLGVMSANYLPKSGQVLLDGKAITQYKPKELARKLAVVHQQNDAPADITVERLTRFGRLPHRSMFSQNSDEDDEAVEWALACTKLQAKRQTSIDQLSGGERQRVWIAMALAQKTRILFLDEPTTFLDIYYQIEILQLIRELNVTYGITVVMVLHDMNQAIRYSDQIIVMSSGNIVMSGTPEKVMTEEMIKRIYGVNTIIKHDEDVGIYVIPMGV